LAALIRAHGGCRTFVFSIGIMSLNFSLKEYGNTNLVYLIRKNFGNYGENIFTAFSNVA
jgi:hypothetical protein